MSAFLSSEAQSNRILNQASGNLNAVNGVLRPEEESSIVSREVKHIVIEFTIASRHSQVMK